MKIVSGIRPTGDLHIGNYLGAIRQFVALQQTHECFFFIADLHALNQSPEPELLRKRKNDAAIAYLALGLDPQKAVLFMQSDISAHSELATLLSNLAPVGELQRMTQYKEEAQRLKKQDPVNAGLLMYPVLMAADILLYRPNAVPIGDDQRQHLEFARNTAKRFNQRFGDFFTIPEAILQKENARIMSLADPKKKMSKSHGPDTVVGLFDDPETIRRKVRSAVTDSGKEISYDPKRKPALANLLAIYAAFADETPQESAGRFSGAGYAELKKALAEHLIEKLAPFRERRTMLEQSPAHVREILERGSERASAVAEETLREVRRRMGID